ncbi:MAG TPA: helix-turn-helix transcriptional regulator [Terriglobales bacterium]|nr:helix-turn-helix transcriptional regulator [Terriglobales bacterium]
MMDRRIETAIHIMHLEKNRNLPVRELARKVHLSEWHFIHLFKAETSVTPKQFIRYGKLKQAEELLGKSFLSVKEVAANVGFGDRSHFSRDFKKISGQAPSQFRDGKKNATHVAAISATE